ncbi:MAG: hypothetical protein JST00_47710 [Deltaproteobacteria bacterium]|nr:hypothetical protein [Deltaproteobacteria bacterium]
MHGIPPAKDSDAEDVVWGLQTAEALWKRGERLDAIVWLRRAAQAAGDAADDDRALELARFAAELSESMSTVVPPAASAPPPPPAPFSAPPVPYDALTTRPYTSDIPPPNQMLGLAPAPAPAPPAPAPEPNDIEEQIPIDTASDVAVEARTANSVPPADMVHAGMFNPWDEAQRPSPAAPEPAPLPSFPDPPAQFRSEDEEVVTSVRPQALAQQLQEEQDAAREAAPPEAAPPEAAPPAPLPPKPAPPRPVAGARKPPPLPPRALKKPPLPPSATKVEAAPVAEDPPASEPPPPPPASEPPRAVSELPFPRMDMEEPPLALSEPPIPTPPPTDPSTPPDPPPSAPADVDEHTPVHAYDAREIAASSVRPSPVTPPPPAPTAMARPVAPERVDLDDVESFADLPDDARAAFAAAATLSALGESEEVSSFALAYVIDGAVDVAATMVDAPALRLTKGAVLRTKGTTEEELPMRLIGTDGGGVVATWSASAVEEAFRTIPWVEDDLRAAADKVLTLVGITIGPLGERLDASIREHIVGLLTMRSLLPGEVVVTKGEVVPGLLLIGVGELELVSDDKVSGVVGCGDFLFAGEVLGAGAAPATARAGTGGALVLFGDRSVAQELLVTCPPLVEVLAGM